MCVEKHGGLRLNALVPIAMFGWIPAVLGLFWVLPPRRAVIAAFLLGWLFLPIAAYKVPGITAYTKMTATCAGILLGAMVFDAGRLLAFRFRWVDLPMAVWCLCPFASSVSNGLGVYDGVSAVVYQTITWGVPYFIGRVYFTDLEGLRELAIGVFIGGLVYAPLCLFEIKMSPQLHRLIYGSHATWGQNYRFGGWRPIVFMQHGLMLGMWMTTASLAGVWLWMSGGLRRFWGVGAGWWLLGLLGTTVLCKSTGAIALLGLGLGILLLAKWTKRTLPLWCLLMAAPLYMATRAPGLWDGRQLVSFSSSVAGDERADSLAYRLRNEDMLAAKALEQPVFGWGGWGRGRVYDDDGRDISVTDGLWIITLGQRGVVGLIVLTASILLPGILLLRSYPITAWAHPSVAPAAALATMLALYMIDSLMNGMVNPVFALAAGATTGTAAAPMHRIPSIQGRQKQPRSGRRWHATGFRAACTGGARFPLRRGLGVAPEDTQP